MRRRDFLKTTAVGGLSMGLPFPLVHGSRSTPRRDRPPTVVVIYLRGGMDALNAVVPYAEDRYYALRPSIAIPPENTEDADGVVKLDAKFGLHPALASFEPLWKDGHFAPIVCAGSPHPTRSHFDAQDFMEYAAPGSRSVRDGWLNRYLTATQTQQDSDLRAVAMQGLLPRALRGRYPVVAVPRGRMDTEDLLDDFEELYGESSGDSMDAGRKNGDPMARPDEVKVAGRTTVRALRRYEELAKKRTRSVVKYPRGRFASRLKRIAHLIRVGEPLEVACVDYTGWDHHIDQGGANGQFAPKLRQVARAITAFIDDIEEHFERTLILTMTEFGRTCAENGNAGTDHGHGGAMLAFGGGLTGGGRVLGDWPGLRDGDLYQGRDLRVAVDFRDVMAEVLEHHMGFDLPRKFFLDYKPKKGPGLFRRR